MANEIKWPGTETGVTLYFTVTNFLTGQKWNGTALEAYVVANWGDYDIVLAESPAGGYEYVGDWPAALTTPGFYLVDVFKQAGGSPAVIDRADLQGQMLGYWDGTYFKPVGVDVSQWKGATAPAMTGDAYAVANGRLPAALTANGNIKASLVEILTTALTETTPGWLAAAFKWVFNVETPALTATSVNQTGDSYPDTVICRRILKNKLTIAKATGIMTIFADDGTTPLYTAQLTDKDGTAVVLTGTGPANRAALA